MTFKVNDVVKGNHNYFVVGQVSGTSSWKPLDGGGWRLQSGYTKVGRAEMDPPPLKAGDTVCVGPSPSLLWTVLAVSNGMAWLTNANAIGQTSYMTTELEHLRRPIDA